MSQQYENFGKYILLEKLAMGGMAEVYLAKLTGATGIAKFVAMKRILPQYSDNPEFIEMFKEEAKIAVNLNHNNVVSIFDFGIEQEQFYLVMEFVEGRNLRQILNHMKKNAINFTIEQVAYIIKEVAAGLDHAHRCLDGTTGRPLNITHRDISPQNVMLSFEGEVKVVDFGIAKAESQVENTRAGTIKGKFAYMSPEQAEGLSVDLRTDIFSLGIVLWELLANDRLFSGGNEIAILKKIRACNIPDLDKINPNVPHELVRICKKALAKDRNARYQTASAMHKDLNRFLNTHFPDFSAQDFSIFMKTLYSDVVLDNRKKFISFSQVSSLNNEDSEVTEVSLLSELSGDLSPDPAQKVSLDGLNKSSVLPTSTPWGAGESTTIRPRPNFRGELKPTAKNSPAVNALLFAAFGLLCWGIWGELRDRGLLAPTAERVLSSATVQSNSDAASAISEPSATYPENKSAPTSVPEDSANAAASKLPTTKSSDQKPTAGVPPMEAGAKDNSLPSENHPVQSQTGVHVVHIQSSPSGAEIYINNESTRLITPGRVRVPANTPFTLGLKRNGYIDYEHRFITRNDTSHKATLQKVLQGSVDIFVSNGGANPIIKINGQALSEKPPILKYRVPANTSLIIKAENPFTQTSAEQTIQLKDSEKKKIHLILR